MEYTPGHASHHVSYLHEPTGTAFVGDVGGVRVDGGPIIPPTPPPDIDIELWHASLDTVAAWEPARLAITHFGTYDDVGAHIAAMHEALDRWAALARETDAAVLRGGDGGRDGRGRPTRPRRRPSCRRCRPTRCGPGSIATGRRRTG